MCHTEQYNANVNVCMDDFQVNFQHKNKIYVLKSIRTETEFCNWTATRNFVWRSCTWFSFSLIFSSFSTRKLTHSTDTHCEYSKFDLHFVCRLHVAQPKLSAILFFLQTCECVRLHVPKRPAATPSWMRIRNSTSLQSIQSSLWMWNGRSVFFSHIYFYLKFNGWKLEVFFQKCEKFEQKFPGWNSSTQTKCWKFFPNISSSSFLVPSLYFSIGSFSLSLCFSSMFLFFIFR